MTARCAEGRRGRRRGFTLVELAVACALAGTLFGILSSLGPFHGRPAVRTQDRLANAAAARAVVARLVPDLGLARAIPAVAADGLELRIPIRPRDQEQVVVYRADPRRGVTRQVVTAVGSAVLEAEQRLLLEAPLDLRFTLPAGGPDLSLVLLARSRLPAPGEVPDPRDEVRLTVELPARALDEAHHVPFWAAPRP